jgi:hypothetical protein
VLELYSFIDGGCNTLMGGELKVERETQKLMLGSNGSQTFFLGHRSSLYWRCPKNFSLLFIYIEKSLYHSWYLAMLKSSPFYLFILKKSLYNLWRLAMCLLYLWSTKLGILPHPPSDYIIIWKGIHGEFTRVMKTRRHGCDACCWPAVEGRISCKHSGLSIQMLPAWMLDRSCPQNRDA